MQNPCLWSNVTITAGAVIAFFCALGIATRSAYLTGFAAGFTEARARFLRVIKSAQDRKIRRVLLAELERSEQQLGGAQDPPKFRASAQGRCGSCGEILQRADYERGICGSCGGEIRS